MHDLSESISLIFPIKNNFPSGTIEFNLNQIEMQLQNLHLESNFIWFQYNSNRILSKTVNESEWQQITNRNNTTFIELFRVCLLSSKSALIIGNLCLI